jgi:hypothetical protein
MPERRSHSKPGFFQVLFLTQDQVSSMIIKARSLNLEEQSTLLLWQKADHLAAYLLARTLHMSHKGWPIADIALALMLTEEEVIHTIQTFNPKGLEPFLPPIRYPPSNVGQQRWEGERPSSALRVCKKIPSVGRIGNPPGRNAIPAYNEESYSFTLP